MKGMTKEQKMQLVQTFSAQQEEEGAEGKASFWVEKLSKPGTFIL